LTAASDSPERVVLECLAELPYPLSRAAVIRLLMGAPESPLLRDRARHFGALGRVGVASAAGLLDDLSRRGWILERWRLMGRPLLLTKAGRRALERMTDDQRPTTNETDASWVVGPSSLVASRSEEDLLEQLRAWRQAQARAERRLPYFVLADGALRAIARERPRTVPRLMALPGVGVERGRAYGPEILRIVAEKD
jgi:ATP-dependent DNA helicase RecQ